MFLGFAISDAMFAHVLETDRGMPIQTQRFGWSVISSLREADVEVDLVSVEPTTDFPHSTRMVVRGRRFRQHSVDGESISFVNVTGLKHLTRWISGLSVARRHGRCRPDAILIHGVHSPLLWVGLRLGRRWSIPVVAIVTDAPSLPTVYDNRMSTAMKAVDRRLIRRGLAAMDGVIALTPTLLEEFASGRPSLLMEGIAADVPCASPRGNAASPQPVVVYAGGLHESYGVLDLLASVNYAREAWELRIYGRGPVEGRIREAAGRDARIKFAGAVPPDSMPSVYAIADILVNPRPADGALAARSFPSKLLEYMSTGVSVVTTDLPTLPTDYREHLVIAQAGARGLAHAIDRVAAETPESRRSRGEHAREFILSTRGSKPQGQSIKGFLQELRRGTRGVGS